MIFREKQNIKLNMVHENMFEIEKDVFDFLNINWVQIIEHAVQKNVQQPA